MPFGFFFPIATKQNHLVVYFHLKMSYFRWLGKLAAVLQALEDVSKDMMVVSLENIFELDRRR